MGSFKQIQFKKSWNINTHYCYENVLSPHFDPSSLAQNKTPQLIYTRVIPIKIESELNCREHWAKKSKRHAMQKMAVKSFLRADSPDIKLPCTIHLIRIAPRKYDSDNLVGGCKYVKDACAEHIHPNLAAGRADDDINIHWEYSQEKGAPKEYALRIEIYQ